MNPNDSQTSGTPEGHLNVSDVLIGFERCCINFEMKLWGSYAGIFWISSTGK